MSSVPLGTMNLAPVTPLTVFSLFHYQRTNNTYEMLKNMSGKPSFVNKNMNVRHLITMLNSRVDVGFGFVQNSVRRPDFWSVWLLPFWFLKNLILAALLTSSLQGWSAVFFCFGWKIPFTYIWIWLCNTAAKERNNPRVLNTECLKPVPRKKLYRLYVMMGCRRSLTGDIYVYLMFIYFWEWSFLLSILF